MPAPQTAARPNRQPDRQPVCPSAPASARPLRVLMVGPLPPPVGGMASVVENLVTAFGGEVEVRVLNNVKTTDADRHLWQGVAAQLRLLGGLIRGCLGWRPALVHIHTCSWFTFWRNGVDVVLARLLGRRVVLHIHGGQFRSFLYSLTPIRAWLARRLLGRCERVIVLGEGWKALLDQWTDPRRVVVVPNGVAVPSLPVDSGCREEPFRIICLANYDPAKGQADLLRAVAQLQQRSSTQTDQRQLQVELPGYETAPGQRQALLDLASQLGIADQIRIPGLVTGAAKEAQLRAADCFCLPSYDEGLPMSMLEAMALALPVVVTRVGAIPEAVRDGVEGNLFEPGDVAALAHHLQSLRDDPALARAIGRAGRARVEQDFSLDRSVARLFELYASTR